MTGQKARFRKSDDDAYADAVRYLCLHASEVRDAVGEHCWRTAIPDIASAEPSTPAWRAAITVVHRAMEDAGVPGGLGLRFLMGDKDFPRVPTARSAGWVCPGRHCSRVVLRDPSSDEPTCELLGRPMRIVE